MGNFRKGQDQMSAIDRLFEPQPRNYSPLAPLNIFRGTRIDTYADKYVAAVQAARESGALYEGIDMKAAVEKARAEKKAERKAMRVEVSYA